MSTSTLVHAERSNLADLLLAAGPDAPTLCAGWTTRDLAAHLVIREGRPDAAAGIVIAPLAKWTSKVQADTASQPYQDLVAKFREGPPRWSPFSIASVDSAANIVEFAVHAEDVRRAEAGWVAGNADPELSDVLWSRLPHMSKLLLRSLSMGITVRRTDTVGEPASIKTGSPVLTITGTPIDIMMLLHGRSAVDVQIEGDEQTVAAFKAAKLGL
ncbi:MAG: TIGR03085 family metal-binding protein [Actinomycetota bacterium]|nr:TIGR03085 family metal-binding protein [Actinomycetota bacterium]